MVLQVSNPNNIKIYTVSGGDGTRSIPDWLARRNKKALKKDPEWRTRIELIQDFEFPEASNRIKTTRDGKFAIATGVYKPQMRVFEYAEMSMKFDRHTDAETVNFEILSDDWTKLVLLQNDRTIEFHTQGGIYYRTRIPKFGRDLSYHYPSCDLLVGAGGNEVYRLNLEQGRFLNSFITEPSHIQGVNCVEINPAHQLLGFGTAAGTVEFWDPRSRARIGLLSPARHLPAQIMDMDEEKEKNHGPEVTALKYRDDGLTVAIGTSTGHTLLYDLRSPLPYLVKDHQYGFPIKSINFHESKSNTDSSGGKVIVADCKIIKIWDRVGGKHFTSIEPSTDINDVCLVPDSGLLFVANEGIQMGSYYIPMLGPAPKWASFLDNVTEEMEENSNQNIYDNYKFITRKETTALGLDHLIGTNLLKAYMHGFFVDLRLYEKAYLIANPFAYDDFKKQIVSKKIEEERKSRIRAITKLPKVNKQLAAELLNEDENKRKKGKKDYEDVGGKALLEDERFKSMFEDPEFEVDKETEQYQLLHPTAKTKNHVQLPSSDEEEEVEEKDEREESIDSNSSHAGDSSSESDEDLIAKIRKSREDNHGKMKKMPKMQGIRSAPSERWTPQERTRSGKKREVRMTEMMIGQTPVARTQASRFSKKSFADRVTSSDSQKANKFSRPTMGGMEMSYKVRRKNGKVNGKGPRKEERIDGGGPVHRERRSASKNVFRKMRK